ncbi:flagellin [Aliiglaciecola sp. CAU 1673]|uniref:flagellin N-terminal helical domain-containing protein n=1 Tax=Aliiglaciecola sp. CAU 1673 TaxID=3032595 RepID=UPI0023D9C3E3|nr:flagellin [Aliiglaciecola sp. CAU 1673]MDF2178299.1 flagellin [Aliiglaciecola sp. CAU 1673]
MRIDGNAPNFVQQQDKTNNLLKQLASARRINSAADDAAGLQISNRLTSQIESFSRGIQNGQDGISLLQSAESGLAGVSDAFSRIRELSIQAGNGALTDRDRQALQAEVSQLQEQVSTTVQNTNFAGVPLLNQDLDVNIQLGDQDESFQLRDVASELTTQNFQSIDISNQAGAQGALGTIDNLQTFVNDIRANFGAGQNRLDAAIRNLGNQGESQAAARSRIADTDFAAATAQRAANDILGQGSIAVQAQANIQRAQVLSLLD